MCLASTVSITSGDELYSMVISNQSSTAHHLRWSFGIIGAHNW
jgi:hypothetical protein